MSHKKHRVRKLFQVLVVTLAVTVVLGFLGFAWLILQFNRPPFDLALLCELRQGMSQADVQNILGEPTSAYTHSWAYSRPLAWPIVYVYFDENGQFVSSEYDY